MSENGRPPQITMRHLERLAVAYARQSTEKQVQQNEGSTADQRAQIEYAKRWGWPAELIELNDVDLGLSGTATANRKGYLRLQSQLHAGKLGLVLVSDLSRLGRDAVELFSFLNDCATHDTLIAVSGQIQDLADAGQMLTQRVISSVVEFENMRRRDMMMAGKLARLNAGKAISPPPAGYVRGGDGIWELDADPLVQGSIRVVFDQFLRCRSLVGTIRALKANDIRIPRRDKLARLRWVDPAVHNIAAILHRPAYRGDYVYRRRRVLRERTASGRLRTRPSEPHECKSIENHHPAYVSREAWDEVQSILKNNAPAKARRSLGPGTALVQGIIRCGVHHRSMVTFYHSHAQKLHSFHEYKCHGDYLTGGRQCCTAAGFYVDRAVHETVLAKLSPPPLMVVREQWREAKLLELSGQRRRDLTLHRARLAVEEAKDRALSVDRSLRHVAAQLDAMWEEAEKELQRLESQHDSGPSVLDLLDERSWDDLLALSQNVAAIWDAETTEDRDRKELTRMVVKTVFIEGRTREEVRLRIVWQDGEPDTPVEIKLPPYAWKQIQLMAARGVEADKIAGKLNRLGMVTTQGNPWSKETVQCVIRSLRKRGELKGSA